MSDGVATYLVKGADEALVAEAVRRLLGELRGDDAALDVEDLGADDDLTGHAIVEACQAMFLGGNDKIVVARNAGRLRAEDVDRLVAYLADPNPTTTLVLVAAATQAPARLLTAVKQAGRVVDASAPTGRARTGWLAERIKAGPVRLDRPAVARLTEHLGEDVSRLGGILDVLAVTHGEGAVIGVDELEPVLGQAGATAPWDLTDAIDAGDREQALGHLHRMLEAGDRHPMVILATLHRHYQAMLRLDGSGAASEAEAAAVLGLRGSTFPARKALDATRRLGHDRIARAIALLAGADLDLRGVKEWPPELVLEVLVARLCQLRPRAAPARR